MPKTFFQKAKIFRISLALLSEYGSRLGWSASTRLEGRARVIAILPLALADAFR
jgi:hypothetical protein